MNLKNIKKWVNKIHQGDALDILKKFPDECVDCIVTSPPYWGLRDYNVEGQIGLELTLKEYIDKLLDITKELKRVLKKSGVMFWNHGDSYCGQTSGRCEKRKFQRFDKKKYGYLSRKHCGRATGSNPYQAKCKWLQNYRLILRMIDEQGWILRNDIVWHKLNSMPTSAKDRFNNTYEPVFMLVKNQKYWFDLDVVRESHKLASLKRIKGNWKGHRELSSSYQNMDIKKMCHIGGKNPGNVWSLPLQGFSGGHFAVFSEDLLLKPILSSCPEWICQECGKARMRITKKEYENTRPGIKDTKNKTGTSDDPQKSFHDRNKCGQDIKYKTTGWTKCDCKNPEYRAGIVLDPFMGAGTTAFVAKKLSRNYIGIELNQKYIEMAEERLKKGVVDFKLPQKKHNWW